MRRSMFSHKAPRGSSSPWGSGAFLGVWQTGEAARRVSASNPEWLAEYQRRPAGFPRVRRLRVLLRRARTTTSSDFGGDKPWLACGNACRRMDCRLILRLCPEPCGARSPAGGRNTRTSSLRGTEERLAAAEPQLPATRYDQREPHPGLRARPRTSPVGRTHCS